MPKVVVRKGYRCQPGKRREVLTALQRIDAAAAGVGYPRGRYLFVETRSPGEPDLEVEFVFESYAEMEQLERRMREHVARMLRDGGSTGQEFLLEPSATRYLLLLDEIAGAPASPTGQARRSTASPGAPSRPAASTPAAAPRGPLTAAGPASEPARSAPEETPPWGEDDDEEFDETDFPEPEVTSRPPPPPGVTPEQHQANLLAAAKATLQLAERTVNLQPRSGPAGSQKRRREGTGEDPARE
jgi:hypothetical protein